MAFVRTTNKMDAIKAFVNTWLKDQTFYCNNCGIDYFPDVVDTGEGVYQNLCCDDPNIGRNIDHTKAIIDQNSNIRSDLDKSTAATKDGSIRFAVSLPPRLYNDLKRYFEGYGEKFLDTPSELKSFMRNFPQFCIPEKGGI